MSQIDITTYGTTIFQVYFVFWVFFISTTLASSVVFKWVFVRSYIRFLTVFNILLAVRSISL